MWSHLLILFVFSSLSNFKVVGVKVSSRFDALYDPNARCLIQKFRRAGAIEYGPRALVSMYKSTINFHKLNCTFDDVDYESNDDPDENGTYPGVIGMIQRHEQDIAWLNLRPDALPHEPGKISPVVMPADMTIISFRNRSRVDYHEITSFLNQDTCVYTYSAIVLAFMAGCPYAFAETILGKRKFTARRLWKKYLQTLNQLAALLVDQEQFEPKTLTGVILTLCICIFSFVCIFGIFLNIVGADLVVHVEPDKIDSLDDLLEHNLQPYIIKNLYVYNLMKASPEGSKLRKLWHRTGAVNKGIFLYDLNDGEGTLARAMQLIDLIINSKAALIVPHYTFDPAPKTVACLYFKQLENVTTADQLFMPGFISALMSSKIHPYTEKVFTYIGTTLYETQLFYGALKNVLSEPERFKAMGLKIGRRELKCGEKTSEHNDRDPSFSAFTLVDMITLFDFYFLGTIAGFIPFVFSLITYELYIQYKGKIQRRNASVSPLE